MNKRILVISATLIFLLGSSLGFAKEEHVTLEKATAVALENSLSLIAAQLELDDARLALDQARAENLVKPNPANLIQAEYNYDIARRKLLMTEFEVAMEVKQDYYTVLKAQDMVELTTKALELSERQLTVAKSKFAAGTGTQSEVINSVGAVAKSKANLAEAEGGYQLALLKFRQTLGVSLDAAYLPGALPTTEFEAYLPNLERDLDFALNNRVEVIQVNAGILAAQTQIEAFTNDYTPELALRRATVALRTTENMAKQLRYGITLELRQNYINLQTAQRKLEAEQESVKEAKENQRIAQRLLEANMATHDQVLASEVGLLQATINARHALYDYDLGVLKYQKAAAYPLKTLTDQEKEH
ncbi:MAG: TolC family protein [Limnochordia bacterium]|nr:TolC family protein [Limnochordia bacterium]MDD4517498.1 TolC family protein [Limnochordia bacterium]